MKIELYVVRTFALAMALLCTSSAEANVKSNNLEFAGFARLVAGVTDEDQAKFNGYDDSLSISEESLLGVQLNYNFNDKWSVTTQALALTESFRDSGISWLFLTYQPSKSVSVKAGRMRTPFFRYSDAIDVGYAYNWITPPLPLYRAVTFETYDGLNLNYHFDATDFSADLEVFYGEYDGNVRVGSTPKGTKLKASNMHGMALTVNVQQFDFRFSYHSGEVEIFPEQGPEELVTILNLIGYSRMADQLKTEHIYPTFSVGVVYEDLNYYVRAEWMRNGLTAVLMPKIYSFYVSAGYVDFPFTYHAALHYSDYDYKRLPNEVPLGLDSQLDILHHRINEIGQFTYENNLQAASIGMRWDFAPSWAAKVDYTLLTMPDNSRGYFTSNDYSKLSRRVNMLQFAVEWVF